MATRNEFYEKLGEELGSYGVNLAETKLKLEKGGTVLTVYAPNNMTLTFHDPHIVEMAKIAASDSSPYSMMDQRRLIKRLYAIKVLYEGDRKESFASFYKRNKIIKPQLLGMELEIAENQLCIENSRMYKDALDAHLCNTLTKMSGVSSDVFLKRISTWTTEKREDELAELYFKISPEQLQDQLEPELAKFR